MGNCPEGKYLSEEMSGRGILRRECVGSGSCLFGGMSVGEVSLGEVSVGDLFSGKCQSGNCPIGELSAYQILLVLSKLK